MLFPEDWKWPRLTIQTHDLSFPVESIGSYYKEKHTGTFGKLGILSFNGNKIITTGGGGILLTDHQRWAERAKYLSTQARDCAEEFIHNEIGYNYRLTNIQAAMGCAQMRLLARHVAQKRAIAHRYTQGLKCLECLEVMREAPWAVSTFWLYAIRIGRRNPRFNARKLKENLRRHQVESRLLWKPLNRLPLYRTSQAYKVEMADQLYQETLCLPCSVGLGENQQQQIIKMIVSA